MSASAVSPHEQPGQWATLVLIAGWAAPRPSAANYDPELGELWRAGLAGTAARWTQHETYLRSEAERLKLPRLWSHDGRAMFFGEMLAEHYRCAKT